MRRQAACSLQVQQATPRTLAWSLSISTADTSVCPPTTHAHHFHHLSHHHASITTTRSLHASDLHHFFRPPALYDTAAMRLHLLSLLGAFASFAVADVEFSSPAAGGSVAAGTITIKWKDSGDSPAISDLSAYQLFLCAGGNEAFVRLLDTKTFALQEHGIVGTRTQKEGYTNRLAPGRLVDPCTVWRLLNRKQCIGRCICFTWRRDKERIVGLPDTVS